MLVKEEEVTKKLKDNTPYVKYQQLLNERYRVKKKDEELKLSPKKSDSPEPYKENNQSAF